MRITVNLSQIFRDHRLEAKIFIKESMKCIKDLEDHISKIFHIDNFCLKCEGHYLPPLEDVQLVHREDVIWVTPLFAKKSSGEQSDISTQSSLETGEVKTIKDNSKKRQLEELPTSVNINKLQAVEASSNISTDLESREHFRNQSEHIWSSQTNNNNKNIKIIKNVLISDCFSVASLNIPTKEETLDSNSNLKENTSGTSINSNDNTILDSTGQKRKRIRTKKYANKFPAPNNTLKLPTHDFVRKFNSTEGINLRDDLNEKGETSVIIDYEYLVDCIKAEALKAMVGTEAKEPAAFKETHFSEFIRQQPIMVDIQPKEGDVIGFKVHKLSDPHAPEVSSIIVGKVIAFNSENSEVFWDIIYGQDQCSQSQVKSSTLEEGSNNTQFHCKWSDLLDPRLLPQ